MACRRIFVKNTGSVQKPGYKIGKYKDNEELRSSGTGGTIIMTKGRKTTFEERVEIVRTVAHMNVIMLIQQKNIKYLINRLAAIL